MENLTLNQLQQLIKAIHYRMKCNKNFIEIHNAKVSLIQVKELIKIKMNEITELLNNV